MRWEWTASRPVYISPLINTMSPTFNFRTSASDIGGC